MISETIMVPFGGQDVAFNEEWYLARYPDVSAWVTSGSGRSGLTHYKLHGESEQRHPNSTVITVPSADTTDRQRINSSVAREDIANIYIRLSERTSKALSNLNLFFGHQEIAWANPEFIIEVPKTVVFEEYSSFWDSMMNIGAFSYSENAVTQAVVGRYCSIAQGFSIFGERHPLEWVTTSSITYCFNENYNKPQFLRAHRELFNNEFQPARPKSSGSYPVIEHDVWIGQDVTLARDIRIGVGSVIAAGSIVTKTVEPYTVVGGNPARVMRRRFSEELSERLLSSRWWEYDPKSLWQCDFQVPEKFCDTFESLLLASRLKKANFRKYDWVALMKEIDSIED